MAVIEVDGQLYDFRDIVNPRKFETPGFTKAIYQAEIDGLWEERVQGQILNEEGNPITKNLKIYQWCLYRLLKLQAELSKLFIGYDTQVRMLMACAIAQEPILFVGRPGVAKTEMAVSFFGGIGLRKPKSSAISNENPADGDAQNKYFEYLLSPFTVPEELFGPLDFRELEKGTVTRINTNMVTGKLVRGIFLDEIFNASSNILNTLLTLINERRYFDRGMFQDADLKIFIGASNTTPVGKYGSGDGMPGRKSGELAAFYDRFTVRLYLPTPQEIYQTQMEKVMKAYELIDKISHERFMERLTLEKPKDFGQIACINDILLLGRVLPKVGFSDKMKELKNMIVSSLAVNRPGRDLCSMSPRKPNKLLPIIMADTFLLDIAELRAQHVMQHRNEEDFAEELRTEKILEYLENSDASVMEKNLGVFHHIWDYEGDRERLKEELDVLLDMR